ncbi:diguanylate cyclase [Pantoea phytobeneficialis]|uniref:diguanylate cyclase n=1 Tax=Pantoea phytobeneficialis TaxID=2052056 RepID=A0AAP9H759_9GAMM|nr:diguanylate cyclase [Pantoea phytobeneficialis]MDO6405239.1 diguanylate cyclase [Pantoea phytobeneficialis]QGR07761.1 diguanylate cyclase [Pantoea phytobeneficialis]
MTLEILTSQDGSKKHWLNALYLGVVAFVLTLFCLELIIVSGRISPLWFSTALMTIVVFRAPVHRVPLLLLGCMVGTALANLLVIGPAVSNLKFALLNMLQALMGGIMLRVLLDRRAPLDSLLDWGRYVVTAGIIAPFVGGLLALWLLSVSGTASLPFFSTWVISEVIGMLALGPVLLLWPLGKQENPVARHRSIETILTLAFTLLASYLSLRYLPWPFTFIVVILFWCAIRLPKFEAFLLFLLNSSFISLLLAFNLVNLGHDDRMLGQAGTWLPFLLVLIPSHVMALVMDAFQREKNHIAESETRFRNAMEYSAIGMALVSPQGNWLQVNQSLCRTLGFPAEELRKLTFQQITHPDDLNNDLQQLRRLLEGEIMTYTLEKRYFRKDGETVWARLTVSVVRDAQQQPLYFISQIVDISELKQSEQVNRRLMERITLANEAGGIGVWEWNLVTGELMWDKRMYELFALAPHEVPTYDLWLQRVHPTEQEYVALTVQQAIERRSAFHMEYRIGLSEGIRYVRTEANRILSQDGQIERMLGISQDITHLRTLNDALFQEKERMAITLDSIGEAVISTNDEMQVTFMNPVAEKMTGWTQDAAAGMAISELLNITHGPAGARIHNLLLCQLPAEKTTPDLEEELVLHTADGGVFEVHYSITPLKTLTGESIGAVMVIQDVSESRKMMKRLSYSASHDMLTRLPNRLNFERQFKRLLSDAAVNQHQHVLVFIDLDKFKAVNDTAGHAAGDALLRELSELMQHHIRSSDFLARLGGDEFGLLLPDCEVDDVREVVQRLVTAINQYRFMWLDSIYQVGASAGMTQIDEHNCISNLVMSQADVACYSAKHAGRGQYHVYQEIQM